MKKSILLFFIVTASFQSLSCDKFVEVQNDYLPDYYIEEINRVIDILNNKKSQESFNYIVISDTHDDDGAINNQISDYCSRQLNAAIEISNKTNSLFIVHLGDITTGYPKKEDIISLSEQFYRITKQAKCPVFFVRGNHDDATDVEPKDKRTLESSITGREFLEIIAAANNERFHIIDDHLNTCAYYYDFVEQKVRVIAIDNQDCYPFEFNEDGYLVYTGGLGNWRGINENQIQWLINKALLVPEGYRIVLLGHNTTHSKLTDQSAYGKLHNYDLFNAIKVAFNRKSPSLVLKNSIAFDDREEFLPEFSENGMSIPYPSWILGVNFQDSNGKIIIESSGHHHSDTFWQDEAGIVQNNIGSAAYHMQWAHSESSFGLSLGVTSWESIRIPDTITEALMDIIHVDNKKISRIRFGAKEEVLKTINEYDILANNKE